MEAPPEAVWVSIHFTLISKCRRSGPYCKEATLLESSPDSLGIDDDVNLTASEGQLDHAPADGSVVATNPRLFIWIPVRRGQRLLTGILDRRRLRARKELNAWRISISVSTLPLSF